MITAIIHAVKRRNRSLAKAQDGQVLLLGAIMFLMLAAVSASVIPVGQAITSKVQAQNAADAAAMATATWLARGSNLLQETNGFLWDFDDYMITLIVGAVAYYDAKIASDCSHWYDYFGYCEWATVYYAIKGHEKIKKLEKYHKDGAEGIHDFQEGVVNALPFVAFLHANYLAGQNGADLLDLDDVFLLDKIPGVKDIQKVIDDTLGKIGIQPSLWILSPSLNPWESMKFAKEVTAEDEESMPLATKEYNPFLGCMAPFLNFVSWNDKYYESSDNLGKPITFVVTRKPEVSFIFNSFLQPIKDKAATKTRDRADDSGKGGAAPGKNEAAPKRSKTPLIPSTCAFASAKFTGDKLTASGIKDSHYYAFLVGAVSWDPDSLVRLWEDHTGKFKPEMVPVKFMNEVDGKDLFILH